MIIDKTSQAKAVCILAHGAGAPMDSTFMTRMSSALVAQDIHVVRFEFAYMAQRRTGGNKRPPPNMPTLVDEFERVCAEVSNSLDISRLPLYIGGKSMGCRVATLLAASPLLPPNVRGVVCFGYPFHPSRQPEKTRIDHLPAVSVPLIIVQGTRDALGNPDDTQQYTLPPHLQMDWLETADHDFVPLKRSGFTQEQCIEHAARIASDFMGCS